LYREWCDKYAFEIYLVTKYARHYPSTKIYSAVSDTKIINVEGQFLAKLRRVPIQDPKGCCVFQMPLVYNRVC
jgi:hypothetical protein